MSVKILIVDDHPLVLEGLKSLLSESEGISVVGTATNAIDAIAFLKSNEVDIAFLDINLPDISGIELCKKVKDQFPEVKTLALSTFSERAYVSRMIQNGASGYLIKSSSKEEILDAIDQVQAGGYFMNVNFDQAAATPTPKTIPFPHSRRPYPSPHSRQAIHQRHHRKQPPPKPPHEIRSIQHRLSNKTSRWLRIDLIF